MQRWLAGAGVVVAGVLLVGGTTVGAQRGAVGARRGKVAAAADRAESIALGVVGVVGELDSDVRSSGRYACWRCSAAPRDSRGGGVRTGHRRPRRPSSG